MSRGSLSTGGRINKPVLFREIHSRLLNAYRAVLPAEPIWPTGILLYAYYDRLDFSSCMAISDESLIASETV